MQGVTAYYLCPYQDLQLSGCSFEVIFAAGEWKGRVNFSPTLPAPASCWCLFAVCAQAIARYVDLTSLERDVALEAGMHSDEEDVDWVD